MKYKYVIVFFLLLLCLISKSQKKLLTGDKLLSAKTYYSLEEALKRPKKVNKLSLNSKNSYESLSVIQTFQNLQKLSLSGNHLKTLPLVVTQLPNLQILSLTETQLKTLPWEIAYLSNLQELWIPHNAFYTFPSAITELENLRLLSLGIDSMKYFQNLDNKLPKLEVFYLGNSRFLGGNRDSLDWFQTLKSVSSLVSLKYLVLHNIERIEKLPVEFQSLTNLESLALLNLPNLSIQQAFTILAHLPNLKELDLSWHDLKTLPVEIGEFKQLRLLKLNGNSIEDLPESMANVPNLVIEVGSSQETREKMERIKKRIPSLKIHYYVSW